MLKISKILHFIGAFVLTVTLLAGASVKAEAAEKNDYLPDGWRRISESALSEEEAEQLQKSVSKEFSENAFRLAAPPLTSVQIIDLALDEKDEIHVVVKEMGTSKSRSVYWNGRLCPENSKEEQYITQGNIVVGYIHYFHSGVIYSSSVSGTSVSTSATFINARSPFNQIGASKLFVLP